MPEARTVCLGDVVFVTGRVVALLSLMRPDGEMNDAFGHLFLRTPRSKATPRLHAEYAPACSTKRPYSWRPFRHSKKRKHILRFAFDADPGMPVDGHVSPSADGRRFASVCAWTVTPGWIAIARGR